MHTLLSWLKKPYNLLIRDIKDIYRLLPFKLRIGILVLFLFMSLQATMELMTILVMTQLGLAMGNPTQLQQEFPYNILFPSFPELLAWIHQRKTNALFFVSLLIVLSTIIKNIVTAITMSYTAQISEKISYTIGSEMMERYLYSDYRWHISKASGTALQMMMWRSSISSLLVSQLSAIAGFLTCFVLFGGMMFQQPALTCTIMLTSTSIGAFIYIALRRRIDKTATISAQAGAEESRSIMASTRGIRDVLIYRQQPAFLNSLSTAIMKGVPSRIFLSIANTLPSLSLEVVGFAMIPATIAMLVNAFNATQEEVVSAVMLLMLTAWRVLPYLNRGVGQMVAIRGVRPMALPVLNFLQSLRENRMELPPEPNPDFRFSKEIRLENVGFTYPDCSVESLHNINLTIPKGAFIGLIGASGAGKSTLSNILCGLCAPTVGRFLVDDRELPPADMAAFRKQVGFVPQSPFLMAGTLAENVAFSQWGQPWDEQRVLRACELAAIDFISVDRQGILLPIGENGAGLSGGQAQRLSIARALYAEPSVVIFDEATSALDAGNETIIVSSIEKLRGNITCVIIAHRLSTVQHCDLLFWFDRGHLVAQGSPSEILPRYEASYREGDRA